VLRVELQLVSHYDNMSANDFRHENKPFPFIFSGSLAREAFRSASRKRQEREIRGKSMQSVA
jgi:hypothetical protein